MAEAAELQRDLLKAQNVDGGWGYQSGSSWTEPTALALLALRAQQIKGSAYERACTWLRRKQRVDGGWPPQPSVDTSTWVTSLVLLSLPETHLPSGDYQRGVEWSIRQIRPELTGLERLISRMQGSPHTEEISGGSPWFPGTAAWIGPTVISVLALSEAVRRKSDEKLRARINRGKQYILSRRCDDGGWNHGGTSFRSQNAESYPEMTGIALLALHDTPASDLSVSIARAEHFLLSPTSIEALSWLQMGLLVHGRDRLSVRTDLPCRTTRDTCLRLLALTAHSSNNKLLIQNC
ncbi:MAG: prenyltransferase/squalene oxidase repeat-containing protein [Bryobacteraceae bacterium]